MSDEKIFCGSGRIVKTQFGDVPKISLSKDNINTIVEYMKVNSLEWVNLELKAKKETQDGKPTHYLQVDTWKPEPKQKQEVVHETKPDPIDLMPEADGDDLLPF